MSATDTTTSRAEAVLAAWLSVCLGRTQNDDPAETFRLLAAAVPNLRVDEIAAAAALAKTTCSRLNGLSHRLMTAAENDRRRRR
jgi:hypothetical protein